ncbi:zinc-finger domain-containing protein [uncultured Algimonas sp.]|uniref:zinc-finger domain-containing protein n=1 Tax=uncultured Algimonas sp. TaxID=1547920 RepID=UPI002634988D|nr:zinc-finger domain-containing protein [uncultured Algimonas sp.]
MVARNISPTPRLEDTERDVVVVGQKYVKCDGGGGALGHPVTWLDMGEADFVICKYCDRVFKLDPKAVPGGHQ